MLFVYRCNYNLIISFFTSLKEEPILEGQLPIASSQGETENTLNRSFAPLISSLVFIAGRNAMLRSPYLLTDQHLHSPTPVVPSISAPSTPLRQHGISSMGSVSSVLQKGT